jgi:hypothetical protein
MMSLGEFLVQKNKGKLICNSPNDIISGNFDSEKFYQDGIFYYKDILYSFFKCMTQILHIPKILLMVSRTLISLTTIIWKPYINNDRLKTYSSSWRFLEQVTFLFVNNRYRTCLVIRSINYLYKNNPKFIKQNIILHIQSNTHYCASLHYCASFYFSRQNDTTQCLCMIYHPIVF